MARRKAAPQPSTTARIDASGVREPNNKAYPSEWKRFKKFVVANRLPQDPFLQRDNVDQYFVRVVSVERVKISPESAGRIVTALQWYSTNVEHKGEVPFFVNPGVRSDVANALHDRDIRYVQHMQTARNDPHGNLPTSTLSAADHRKCLDYVFRNSIQKWDEFSISWSVDYSTFMRMHTIRQVRLCDMVAENNHGPHGIEGPNKTILAIVMQPYLSKDQTVVNPAGRRRATTAAASASVRRREVVSNGRTRVVGMYRHRNPLQCGTFHVCREVFMRLRFNVSFSFLEPATGGTNARPTWTQEYLLANWSNPGNQSAVDSKYREILEACQVDCNKVTHLRSSGIERASFLGLDHRRIASMSKHYVDVFGRSYSTELDYQVMLAMAGFGTGDSWYVPRAEVSLPRPVERCVRDCFPRYDHWLQEFNSPRCCKEKRAARNFLVEFLPFVARVVIQDAPFWLREYPDHEFSKFFKCHMPDQYLAWCRLARQQANALGARRDTAQVQGFGSAAR